MSLLIINSYEEFEQYVGKDLGYSEYLTVKQEQINLFAEATLDPQWIHTDPERAAKESPFKTTIAHGYLNVSLLPYLWQQIVKVNNVKLLVNYGIEKLKFVQPVLVNSQVRAHVKLHSLVNLRGVAKATLDVKLEIKDNVKPAMEAFIIFLYHFNKD
jgi:acyl dehydratase